MPKAGVIALAAGGVLLLIVVALIVLKPPQPKADPVTRVVDRFLGIAGI